MASCSCYLWTIDYHGCLYKLDLDTLQYTCISPYDPNSRKNAFKRISSVQALAWAVGADQNVYLCVRETDLPITATEHCYENERWFLGSGWSRKSMFATDRWAWSSKDGKSKREKDSFHLPNACWDWEGEWFIDRSIECDVQGWQYAVDFPATFYSSHGKTTFVRRRKWSRVRKFSGFNQWILMATVDSDDPFHDVAVGGDRIPGQTQGFLAVWGITFAGKVYFRHGITRSCPEGKDWIPVECDFNLVQISVSSSGMLVGCTWDGDLVIRQGIDHLHLTGSSWKFQAPPFNSSLAQLSIGSNALWALDGDEKVYFYRGFNGKVNSNKSTGNEVADAWVEMVGNFELISVTPSDQVFAISSDDQCLYVRSDVRNDELVGRTWKKIDISSQVNMTSRCCCLDSGACEMDYTAVERLGQKQQPQEKQHVLLSSNFSIYDWRNTILDGLCKRNKVESNDAMHNTHGLYKDSSRWYKRCQCKFLVDRNYDLWSASHLKLRTSVDDDSTHVLYIYYSLKEEFCEWVLPLECITCIHRLKHSNRPFTFTILSSRADMNEVKQEIVLDMDNEQTLLEWMRVLSPSQQKDMKLSQLSINEQCVATLWATTTLGEILQCPMKSESISNYRLSELRWRHVSGFLKHVASGCEVTWGYGFDGRVYTYLPQSQHAMENKSIVEHEIFENQRWNPVEGYTDRLLPSDRWSWSDVSGYFNCAKEKYILPSNQHRWMDEWSIAYDPETCDKDGWQYALDFPRWYSKHRGMKDYVRRRKWKRKCRVTCKSMWLEILTDVKILDLSVSMETDHYSVWAVSCNGDVLYRNGITSLLPQGTSWSSIPANCPMTSISVGVNSRVWCVAKDGSCYMRVGFKKALDVGTHWFHIPKDEHPVLHISVGTNLVLAIDNEGSVYYRCEVNRSYPEGTRWQLIWQNVDDISVNIRDQVTFTKNGDVMLCTDVLNDPYKCTVVPILKDGWLGSCCRGVFIHNNETDLPIYDKDADKKKEDNADILDNNDDGEDADDDSVTTSEQGNAVNPYAMDIYSFYGKTE